MKIVKIEIKNYKSIKTWQTIEFDRKLISLIGKNGSGKTSFLEALNAILESNYEFGRYFGEKINLDYRITIKLTKDEIKRLDEDIVYDEANSLIVAYSMKKDYGLKVDRIESETIVRIIRKHKNDIIRLSHELRERLIKYNALIHDFAAPEEYYRTSFCTYNDSDDTHAIQLKSIYNRVERIIENIDKELQKVTTNDDKTLIADNYYHFHIWNNERIDFHLKYFEPKLSKFEKKFVTIEVESIKEEIEKMNQQTSDERNEINRLFNKIMNITDIINAAFKRDYEIKDEAEEKYERFLYNVKNELSKRVFFLKNDDNSIIFNANRNGYYPTNVSERLILETYIKTHPTLSKNLDIIKQLEENKKLDIDKKNVSIELERLINRDIPVFDKNMYKKVKVRFEGDSLRLTLIEKNNDEVDFSQTSSGRKWYFTYYFIKKCLKPSDVFIIDEPGLYLHPDAQIELLQELTKLTREGINVIYSTHSPYLIPNKLNSAYIVSMEDKGSIIKRYSDDIILDGMREQIGIQATNDFILKTTKSLILVEGLADETCISKFMDLFEVNSKNYHIYVCNGNAIIDAVVFCIKNDIRFKALFDRDNLSKPNKYLKTKKYYLEFLDIIKKDSNCIFTPEDGSHKSIEDLFDVADFEKVRFFDGKKYKLNRNLLIDMDFQDFSDTTIQNFKSLFNKLNIKIKKPLKKET